MQPPSENARRSSSRPAPHLVAAEEKGAVVRPPVLALVVDSSPANAWPIIKTLVECGFSVTCAETFAQAKARLIESPPDLLVAELRLREYNGLQLVLRGKSRRPSMGAIVLSSAADPVLQTEAEAMGATFMLRPVDSAELIAATFRTLLRDPARNELADPIRPPFERRTPQRRFLGVKDEATCGTTDRRRDPVTLLTFVARRDP
jgi:DNA-binding response OmpR family regulator